MKKSYDKGMDGEPEAARKRNLIKANLSMSKGASPFVLPRETSPGPLKKLKPIFKLAKDLNFQGTPLLKRVKRTDDGVEVAVSAPVPSPPRLEDAPLSRSPDPTSDPITSLLKTPRTDLNQT